MIAHRITSATLALLAAVTLAPLAAQAEEANDDIFGGFSPMQEGELAAHAGGQQVDQSAVANIDTTISDITVAGDITNGNIMNNSMDNNSIAVGLFNSGAFVNLNSVVQMNFYFE